MKEFIYYNKMQNAEADVAVVKANNICEAFKILKKYYVEVTEENVTELSFKNIFGKDVDIMIISDY